MLSKKELFQSGSLYLVTGARTYQNLPIEDVVKKALKGGVNIVQLRDKTISDEEMVNLASKLLLLTRSFRVPLIINDRLSVAQVTGADGLHLGQEDGPYSTAREVLGESAIIGRSTHSPEQAIAAEKEGFDYIGVGPVFSTPTKPDVPSVGLEFVQFASKNIRIPFVAIGGIDTTNIGQVRRSGAQCVAVVRAIVSSENPEEAAKLLLQS